MDGSVIKRVQRIYAALDQTATGELASVLPLVQKDSEGVVVRQDFTGGLSKPELSNLLHSLLHNIVNLKDHARKACRKAGIDPGSIDDVVDSESFLLLTDLSNNDKHGYPPRDGGHSGKSPQILKVDRILRVTTTGEAGSVTVLSFGSGGLDQSGHGSSQVVITADILDSDGNKVGDVFEACVDALELWETRLKELDLL